MTIKTLDAPCWHRLPTDVQDEVYLADWDPHFDAKAELVVAAASADPERPVRAEQFVGPCRTLACDGCDEEAVNDDTGGVIHFPPDGPEPSVDLVSDLERVDGRVLCAPCVDKAQRDELRKVGG